MTPRDALEVLGRALGNIGDEGYNVTHASLALTVLTALVERAGEPVVEPMYAAMIEADFEHNVVTFEMRGEYVCAAGLYEIRPHTAPAAPGASHEL